MSENALWAQSKKHFVEEKYDSRIWIPSSLEESYQYKVADSTSKSLCFIFEQDFDDSIQVLLNGKVFLAERIKTNSTLSVVDGDREFKINYNKWDNPLIEIRLVDNGKKISFHPKRGYLLCYVNRLIKVWQLEFSNYIRFYY